MLAKFTPDVYGTGSYPVMQLTFTPIGGQPSGSAASAGPVAEAHIVR